jgi:hypothetical protein
MGPHPACPWARRRVARHPRASKGTDRGKPRSRIRRASVVFSRHAGPGETILLIDAVNTSRPLYLFCVSSIRREKPPPAGPSTIRLGPSPPRPGMASTPPGIASAKACEYVLCEAVPPTLRSLRPVRRQRDKRISRSLAGERQSSVPEGRFIAALDSDSWWLVVTCESCGTQNPDALSVQRRVSLDAPAGAEAAAGAQGGHGVVLRRHRLDGARRATRPGGAARPQVAP